VSGAVEIVLRTADGVRLAARHRPAPEPSDVAGVVVAHGFTGSSRTPAIARVCDTFAAAGLGVLAPDLRGHGRSGGVGTAGLTEPADVAAAVAFLREGGHRSVAVVGFSMGGTVVLRHAALGGDADAVVAVSAPGRWWERGTRPMRLVHRMIETRAGRVATRLLRGTRISADGWDDPPPPPAEVVGEIAPRPLLLVHGDADHYFPLHHLEALAAGAPHAEVWVEPGMGHAEVAATPDLLARITRWIVAATGAPAPVCDDGRHE
jgi:uncharacterized protein